MNCILITALPQMDWLAVFDVTEARARPCWLNANGDELASLLGCGCSQRQRFLKSRAISDDMIGWEHEHRGRAIASSDPARPQRNGGCGVAFSGLRDNVFFREIGKQFANGGLLFGICQDQNTFTRDEVFKASDGFFEQSFLRDQSKQLFWPGSPAQRPKTFATATGKNNRVGRIRHFDPKARNRDTERRTSDIENRMNRKPPSWMRSSAFEVGCPILCRPCKPRSENPCPSLA